MTEAETQKQLAEQLAAKRWPTPVECGFPGILNGLAIATLAVGCLAMAVGASNGNPVDGAIVLGAGVGSAVTLRAMALGLRLLLDLRNMAVAGRVSVLEEPRS